jgi:hypothetical protein
MTSLAWMTQQLRGLPQGSRSPQPGPQRAVDVFDVVEYAREKGVSQSAYTIAKQFNVSRSTACNRLREAEAMGLMRRWPGVKSRPDMYEVIG